MENCCEVAKTSNLMEIKLGFYERANYMLVERYNTLRIAGDSVIYPSHEDIIELANKIQEYATGE